MSKFYENGFDKFKEKNGQIVTSLPKPEAISKPENLSLIYRVNEIPKWNTALLIGFQVILLIFTI